MKLDELAVFAEEISSHSRKLVASTENLLMPMIQFSFLFPTILMLTISITMNNIGAQYVKVFVYLEIQGKLKTFLLQKY